MFASSGYLFDRRVALLVVMGMCTRWRMALFGIKFARQDRRHRCVQARVNVALDCFH